MANLPLVLAKGIFDLQYMAGVRVEAWCCSESNHNAGLLLKAPSPMTAVYDVCAEVHATYPGGPGMRTPNDRQPRLPFLQPLAPLLCGIPRSIFILAMRQHARHTGLVQSAYRNPVQYALWTAPSSSSDPHRNAGARSRVSAPVSPVWPVDARQDGPGCRSALRAAARSRARGSARRGCRATATPQRCARPHRPAGRAAPSGPRAAGCTAPP